MIALIEGTLERIDDDGLALVRCGPIGYHVMTPAADHHRLSQMQGHPITFHTLQYFDTPNQGSTFVPRLVGFLSNADRAFFELFTTVKGIGNRKALRALQMPFGDIAAAIARRDATTLTELPEIGKRTAETIILELKDRVEGFLRDQPGAAAAETAISGPASDALAVLIQLGEPRHVAKLLVERAILADPSIREADALVAAAFRLKGSV